MKIQTLQVNTTKNVFVNDEVQVHKQEDRWWVELWYMLTFREVPQRIITLYISTIDYSTNIVTVRDKL